MLTLARIAFITVAALRGNNGQVVGETKKNVTFSTDHSDDGVFIPFKEENKPSLKDIVFERAGIRINEIQLPTNKSAQLQNTTTPLLEEAVRLRQKLHQPKPEGMSNKDFKRPILEEIIEFETRVFEEIQQLRSDTIAYKTSLEEKIQLFNILKEINKEALQLAESAKTFYNSTKKGSITQKIDSFITQSHRFSMNIYLNNVYNFCEKLQPINEKLRVTPNPHQDPILSRNITQIEFFYNYLLPDITALTELKESVHASKKSDYQRLSENFKGMMYEFAIYTRKEILIEKFRPESSSSPFIQLMNEIAESKGSSTADIESKLTRLNAIQDSTLTLDQQIVKYGTAGELYNRLDRLSTAKKAYKQALSLSPEETVKTEKIRLLLKKIEKKEAIQNNQM